MKITLTRKEALSIAKIIDSVKLNGSNELKESLKNNKIISYTVSSNYVSIEIKEECMESLFEICEKYAGLLTSQTKALCESAYMFKRDTESIVEKYNVGPCMLEDKGE